MIETTQRFELLQKFVEQGAPPLPIALKPSPNDNFQIVGVVAITGAIAYGTDPAELIDWATDKPSYFVWDNPNNPAS